MLLVNSTMYRSFFVAWLLLFSASAMAQENSPFSRYGIGDLYPQQSIPQRAMGGVSAAFVSPYTINSANPATYGFIPRITYDIGISIDQRSLKSKNPALTYSSANFLPSYVLIGTPISSKHGWGGVFGIKPVSRVNYSVEEVVPHNAADTLQKLHQGNGGLTQAFIGLGKKWGNLPDPTKKQSKVDFSLGVNFGYQFGRKQVSNIINYVDSTPFIKSNYQTTTSYNGVFVNPGMLLSIKTGESQDKASRLLLDHILRLGASATLEHQLNASQDYIVESFNYDANGAIVPIDTIQIKNGISGKIKIPLTYTAGFTYSSVFRNYGVNKWSIGADYTATNWTDYRFYGQPDQVVNTTMIRAGAEFSPDFTAVNLFSRSTYRIGFYSGKNYINADGNGYTEKAITFGLGFALRKYRGQYDYQVTNINTSFEIGKRGSSVNNVSENYFKFSVGLSLSDVWFIKRKYD